MRERETKKISLLDVYKMCSVQDVTKKNIMNIHDVAFCFFVILHVKVDRLFIVFDSRKK
jgi:hypothetical protein